MRYRFTALLVVAFLMIGCHHGSPPPSAPKPPLIPVSQPVQRDVTDYVDFTGRTDAINSVGIRPRVTGYLCAVAFKEGTEVKKDDLLYEIDPRPYQAQLDQAQVAGRPQRSLSEIGPCKPGARDSFGQHRGGRPRGTGPGRGGGRASRGQC